jgi:hypothetical protein
MRQLIVKELNEVLFVVFSFLYRQKRNKKARSFASLGDVCFHGSSPPASDKLQKNQKGVRTYIKG